MSHSLVVNGGLRQAKGELPKSLAFGRHNTVATAAMVSGGSGRALVGRRIGRGGDARCPNSKCNRVSHYKWGRGPHECDRCGAEFIIDEN